MALPQNFHPAGAITRNRIKFSRVWSRSLSLLTYLLSSVSALSSMLSLLFRHLGHTNESSALISMPRASSPYRGPPHQRKIASNEALQQPSPISLPLLPDDPLPLLLWKPNSHRVLRLHHHRSWPDSKPSTQSSAQH
jgi:hypothetical protein